MEDSYGSLLGQIQVTNFVNRADLVICYGFLERSYSKVAFGLATLDLLEAIKEVLRDHLVGLDSDLVVLVLEVFYQRIGSESTLGVHDLIDEWSAGSEHPDINVLSPSGM